MKVNSSGPKSPYQMTRTSSVGKYQGSGIPAKVGTRRFSAGFNAPQKLRLSTPPKKMN